MAVETTRLAIIGASTGQAALCRKARAMGVETWGFAWEQGAVCRTLVDHFVPLSVTDTDAIAAVCRRAGVQGVVSNASDLTALATARVAERLGLPATPWRVLAAAQDKARVRDLTARVEGLAQPRYYRYDGTDRGLYPCVVKPCRGGGKHGVSFARDAATLRQAADGAAAIGTGVLVEEYVAGAELSVECISCRGSHWVVQVTDKVSGPAPHFVELAHHQPARLAPAMRARIEAVAARVLSAIGFTDGATHIEMKCRDGALYLIEANLRGGGDEISGRLTRMSSGVDYVRCMIDVALGRFQAPVAEAAPQCAGIYFLCRQTAALLPAFRAAREEPWCVECVVRDGALRESCGNAQHDGWLIYQAPHRVALAGAAPQTDTTP